MIERHLTTSILLSSTICLLTTVSFAQPTANPVRQAKPTKQTARAQSTAKAVTSKTAATPATLAAHKPIKLENNQIIRAERNGIYIFDATPRNIAEPRTHVVYDFEQNTVSLLEIRSSGITVQTKSLSPTEDPRRTGAH